MLTPVLDQFSKWFLHHQSFAAYIEPIMQVFKPAWRADLFRAKVVDVQALSGRFLSISLKPSKKWPIHIAGQHISLTVEANGRLLTRVFTLACSPAQYKATGLLRLLVKTDQQGHFTSQLQNALAVQPWCNISSPSGDFVFKSWHKPSTFIAGGSGITPMLAMLDQQLGNTEHQIKLIYFAKAGEHQCTNELKMLTQQYNHFSYVLLTRDRSPYLTTHINTDDNPDIYCCGPAGFMQEVADFTRLLNLTYYQESFGLSMPKLTDDNHFSVIINKDTHVVTSNEVLLNQFEAKKLPVQRGCGIGICHQCQCIKKSGVVRNLKTNQLSDTGEQLIQLCVSQAVSDLELQL